MKQSKSKCSVSTISDQDLNQPYLPSMFFGDQGGNEGNVAIFFVS